MGLGEENHLLHNWVSVGRAWEPAVSAVDAAAHPQREAGGSRFYLSLALRGGDAAGPFCELALRSVCVPGNSFSRTKSSLAVFKTVWSLTFILRKDQAGEKNLNELD